MSASVTAKLAVLVTGAALAAPAASDGFYLCTHADGSVEYADAPCEPGAALRQFPDHLERSRRLDDAVRRRLCFRPSRAFSAGASASDLVDLCGEPMRVHNWVTQRSDREQWVYRQGPDSRAYVYVENGRIVAIQD